MGFFLLTIDKLTITVPHFIVLATGFTALYVGWHILFCRTSATPWIGAFQPRPRPIQVRAVEIFHKAAADPVSFACDILGYSFSVYVASVIYYIMPVIAFHFVKGSIANITAAYPK